MIILVTDAQSQTKRRRVSSHKVFVLMLLRKACLITAVCGEYIKVKRRNAAAACCYVCARRHRQTCCLFPPSVKVPPKTAVTPQPTNRAVNEQTAGTVCLPCCFHAHDIDSDIVVRFLKEISTPRCMRVDYVYTEVEMLPHNVASACSLDKQRLFTYTTLIDWSS
jgi:hypothetical protein